MRIYCSMCGKSCSTEVPDTTVFRAMAVCPECIEAEKVIIPDDPPEEAEAG